MDKQTIIEDFYLIFDDIMLLFVCPYQKDCDEERAGYSYGVPVLFTVVIHAAESVIVVTSKCCALSLLV